MNLLDSLSIYHVFLCFFFFDEKRGLAPTYLLNSKIEKNIKGSSCWMGWRGRVYSYVFLHFELKKNVFSV